MQKFIKSMAIVAVALMGFSLLVLLVSVPFQEFLSIAIIYGIGDDVLECMPIFPTIPFLFTCLRLGCMVALLVCLNKRDSIRFEIVIFICLLVVLPLLNNVVNITGNAYAYQHDYLAARSVVRHISDYCLYFAGWAQAIAYAVCGMSIVYKRMNKELQEAGE